MKVRLKSDRMKALAMIGAVVLAWVLVTQHVGMLSVMLSVVVPHLDQLHFIGALCVVCITLVVLARRFRNR